jgi:hypothetical protein
MNSLTFTLALYLELEQPSTENTRRPQERRAKRRIDALHVRALNGPEILAPFGIKTSFP